MNALGPFARFPDAGARRPRLGVLGSCRVHEPLRLAAAERRVALLPDGMFGYLHNAPEMVQAVAILRGAHVPPLALHSLMSIVCPANAVDGRDRFGARQPGVDAYVVEVSSIRTIEFGGRQLQISHFLRRFKGRRKKEVQRAMHARAADWPSLIDRLIAENDYSPDDLAILSSSRLREQSEEEIEASVRALLRHLDRPVLFVCHIVRDRAGRAIPQRERIRRVLERLVARKPDTALFDPTPAVEAAGHDRAMIDLGHYHPRFEPVIADLLVDGLMRLLPARATSGKQDR